jgi:hypothetical protein
MSRHHALAARLAIAALVTLSLGACASQPTRSGFLKTYDDMKPRKMVRAKADQRKGGPRLAQVRTVAIEPTVLYPSVKADWLTEDARAALLREIDAQLCFELTERYQLAPLGQADARVRAAVTEVDATGRAGSAASAAAEVFIPGPIGVRPPGSTGGLSAEAEMLGKDGRQLAAITWNREAMEIGSDNPALTRVGDALQFAEPFADAAAKAMTPPKAKKREIGKPDPCAEYGPRFRPEGFITKLVTGLYVPQMSAAKEAKGKDASARTTKSAK